jgi:hypothetical protein
MAEDNINISLRISPKLLKELKEIKTRQRRSSIANVAQLAIEEGVKILKNLPDISDQLQKNKK